MKTLPDTLKNNENASESELSSEKNTDKTKSSTDKGSMEDGPSQNKKTYDNISVENRQKFILKVIFEKCTIKQAARDMKIKLSTAKAILKTFKKEGRIGKKKKRNKMSKLKRIMMMKASENMPRLNESGASPCSMENKSEPLDPNLSSYLMKKTLNVQGLQNISSSNLPMVRSYMNIHQDWKSYFETQSMINMGLGPLNTSFSNFMINYFYFKNLFQSSQPISTTNISAALNQPKSNPSFYGTFQIPCYPHIPKYEYVYPIKTEIKEEFIDMMSPK